VQKNDHATCQWRDQCQANIARVSMYCLIHHVQHYNQTKMWMQMQSRTVWHDGRQQTCQSQLSHLYKWFKHETNYSRSHTHLEPCQADTSKCDHVEGDRHPRQMGPRSPLKLKKPNMRPTNRFPRRHQTASTCRGMQKKRKTNREGWAP
jgi:hypothetical protein